MPTTSIYVQYREPSPLQQVWINFRDNPFAVAALYVFGFILVLMILAPWLAPHDAMQQFSERVLVPPSWDEQGQINFFFGTDDLGRDVLSRILYGARYSLGYPLLIVLIAGIVGCAIGAAAGLSKGIKSSSLNHLLDVVLSIPSLLLALIIIAILGPDLGNVVFAISLVLVPQFIHSVRNAVHDELYKDYVIAARLNGCSQWYLLTRVILPNITTVIVMQITLALSTAILDIAALGFLGLGVQAPLPEWGTMLARSLDQVYVSPWVMALPGLALFLTMFSINIIGDSLRAAIKDRVGSS